jgi:hypothetical protein
MVKMISYKMVLLILCVCTLSLVLGAVMLWTVLRAYNNDGTVVIAINHVFGNYEAYGDMALFGVTMLLSLILIVNVFRAMATDAAVEQNKVQQLSKTATDAKFYSQGRITG